jgi:hypothetical protein
MTSEFKNPGLQIPYEVADLITLETLKASRKLLKEDMRDHKEEATYMHPEDYANNKNYLKAMKVLIAYYGTGE